MNALKKCQHNNESNKKIINIGEFINKGTIKTIFSIVPITLNFEVCRDNPIREVQPKQPPEFQMPYDEKYLKETDDTNHISTDLDGHSFVWLRNSRCEAYFVNYYKGIEMAIHFRLLLINEQG